VAEFKSWVAKASAEADISFCARPEPPLPPLADPEGLGSHSDLSYGSPDPTRASVEISHGWEKIGEADGEAVPLWGSQEEGAVRGAGVCGSTEEGPTPPGGLGANEGRSEAGLCGVSHLSSDPGEAVAITGNMEAPQPHLDDGCPCGEARAEESNEGKALGEKANGTMDVGLQGPERISPTEPTTDPATAVDGNLADAWELLEAAEARTGNGDGRMAIKIGTVPEKRESRADQVDERGRPHGKARASSSIGQTEAGAEDNTAELDRESLPRQRSKAGRGELLCAESPDESVDGFLLCGGGRSSRLQPSMGSPGDDMTSPVVRAEVDAAVYRSGQNTNHGAGGTGCGPNGREAFNVSELVKGVREGLQDGAGLESTRADSGRSLWVLNPQASGNVPSIRLPGAAGRGLDHRKGGALESDYMEAVLADACGGSTRAAGPSTKAKEELLASV
jgi:hypothetical protein